MVKSWTGIESSKMDGEWLKGEKGLLNMGGRLDEATLKGGKDRRNTR